VEFFDYGRQIKKEDMGES